MRTASLFRSRAPTVTVVVVAVTVVVVAVTVIVVGVGGGKWQLFRHKVERNAAATTFGSFGQKDSRITCAAAAAAAAQEEGIVALQ